MLSAGQSSCALEPLCPPTQGRLGFFSKGDCALTRASFFQGHEWLTVFGNDDLPERDRFTHSEVRAIADGNRRVDWPLELLVHLNNSILAYANALTEHTNRPEIQRLHFLLSDTNDTEEATEDARDELERSSIEAVDLWIDNRTRSLTLIGRGNHLIQDSFSSAHTVREPENGWCIRKVKAYIPRAPGHLDDDVEFHGTEDDTIGHITTLDSIYREGRDCHEPKTRSAVEACLSDFARRGRLGTRDYLAAMRRAIQRSLDPNEVADSNVADPTATRHERAPALVKEELAEFYETHLSLCE
jgi:hypothetical protein